MASGQSSKPTGWFTGRTRLITVVSIVAVGVAGASAVSANIGILDSASDSAVGNASVIGDLGAPSSGVLDVNLPDTAITTAAASTAPAADPTIQQFVVDVAGNVTVATTAAGLRIDQITPAAGWSWTLTQSDPHELTVTMTNGSRSLEFHAAMTADGDIVASVDASMVTPVGGEDGDEHEDDDEEHEDVEDEHEYEDDEHEEYEGGEDDD